MSTLHAAAPLTRCAWPIFVALTPHGPFADEPASAAAVAGVDPTGKTAAALFSGPLPAAAAELFTVLAGGPVFALDGLCDPPRLTALARDLGAAPPDCRDWLMAFAPFGKAARLTAALAASGARTPFPTADADPLDVALTMAECFLNLRAMG